jgi:DNA-binding Xre family transcriptional regulator
MNIKLPVLTKKIFDLGSYSKPVLNYMLENKIDICYRHYLKSLEYIWKREYLKALKEVNSGLKRCKANISIYYLLLSNKFIISFYINDTENLKNLYNKIRREYKKIPPTVRKITSQFLMNYSLMGQNTDFQKSRFWSKEKELSPSTKLFLLISKARREIKEKRIQNGISYYQKGLKIANKIPHPTGLITCFNDISWYLKDEKPLKSLYYAEKGIYYLGYYYEEPKINFYILDTIFSIEKKLNFYRIFETSELINKYKNDDFVKSKYGKLLKEIKKYNVDFEKNLYKNSKGLRNYLKKYIKNINKASKITKISRDKLYDILNGKTKNIRGETIRKLINSLNIEIENITPNEIFSELIKIKIDENFEKAISFLNEKEDIERNKLIISTYMSLYDRKNQYRYLIKKDNLKKILYLINSDFEKFKEFTNKRYETKRFISYVLNPPIFIKGRRDLVLKFLNNLHYENLNDFINFYLNINEDEREILDIFIRNYIRFNKITINLGENIEIEKYKNIIDFLNLNTSSILLSFYFFSKWERVKFKRLLNKLDIVYQNRKDLIKV